MSRKFALFRSCLSLMYTSRGVLLVLYNQFGEQNLPVNASPGICLVSPIHRVPKASLRRIYPDHVQDLCGLVRHERLEQESGDTEGFHRVVDDPIGLCDVCFLIFPWGRCVEVFLSLVLTRSQFQLESPESNWSGHEKLTRSIIPITSRIAPLGFRLFI